MAEYSFGRFEKACENNGVMLHQKLTFAGYHGSRFSYCIEPDRMYSAVVATADIVQTGKELPSDVPLPPMAIDEADVATRTLFNFINGAHPQTEAVTAGWTLPMGPSGGDSCKTTEGRFATTIRQIEQPEAAIFFGTGSKRHSFQVIARQGQALAIRKGLNVKTTLTLEPVRLVNDQQQTLVCPPGSILATPQVKQYPPGSRGGLYQEVIDPTELQYGSFLRLSAFALAPRQRRRDFNASLDMARSNRRIHRSWTIDDFRQQAQNFIDRQN